MTDTMTPRQRVLAALDHRRPTVCRSTSAVIGLARSSARAYERLKAHLGVDGETRYMKRKSRSVILDGAHCPAPARRHPAAAPRQPRRLAGPSTSPTARSRTSGA